MTKKDNGEFKEFNTIHIKVPKYMFHKIDSTLSLKTSLTQNKNCFVA